MRARSEYETALRLAPNAAEIMTLYTGWASTFGEAERGAALVERVERLDPDFPPSAAAELARAYFMAGRYEAALAAIARLPDDALTPRSGDRRRGARRRGPDARRPRPPGSRRWRGRSGAIDRWLTAPG